MSDRMDHTFKAIHDDEIPWQDDVDANFLTLPEGVQVKVFASTRR